jgi:glutamine synthetase adenylyltransferase
MDADLKQFLEGMEHRLREYIDERTQSLREYIDGRTHDAETRIVRAFGGCQESNAVRMRKIEADVSNVNSSTT